MGRKKKTNISSNISTDISTDESIIKLYEITNKKNEKDQVVKIKKNIDVLKSKYQSKIIKIKPDQELENNKLENKSMENALKSNLVLLYGINKIDSILIEKYEKNYVKPEKNKVNSTQDDNLKSKDEKINRDKFKEFNPEYDYFIEDLKFLNNEYDNIEKKLDQINTINKEYEDLLDLQDQLTEIIDKLEKEAKNSNTFKEIDFFDKNNLEESDENILIEEDLLSKKSDIELESKSDEKNKTKNQKKKNYKKLKPYYWIGNIPDGYREATEEEAILNKKVSWFGKKKISRELFNTYNITGTICIENLNEKEIRFKIIALKGKLRFYKKNYDYNKVTLNTGKLTIGLEEETKEKIRESANCCKKTIDVINFYVKALDKINLAKKQDKIIIDTEKKKFLNYDNKKKNKKEN